MNNESTIELPVGWLKDIYNRKCQNNATLSCIGTTTNDPMKIFPQEGINLSPPLFGNIDEMVGSTCCGDAFMTDEELSSSFCYEIKEVTVYKPLYGQRHRIKYDGYFLADAFGSPRRWEMQKTYWSKIIGYNHNTDSVTLQASEAQPEYRISNNMRESPLILSLSRDEINLSHYFFDCLPRLKALNGSSTIPIVFGYQPAAIQLALLKVLKISNPIYIIEDKTVVFDAVRYATRPEPAWLSANFINWVRSALLNSNLADANFPKKIFIHRMDSETRSLENRLDIMSLLSKHGYSSFHLTGLPLQTQLKLFYNAESIITEQGAGCTLLTVCKPGTHVCEVGLKQIIPGRGPAPHYWLLSNTLGLKYSCILGTGTMSGYDISVPKLMEYLSS
jgi:hypothetical protein